MSAWGGNTEFDARSLSYEDSDPFVALPDRRLPTDLGEISAIDFIGANILGQKVEMSLAFNSPDRSFDWIDGSVPRRLKMCKDQLNGLRRTIGDQPGNHRVGLNPSLELEEWNAGVLGCKQIKSNEGFMLECVPSTMCEQKPFSAEAFPLLKECRESNCMLSDHVANRCWCSYGDVWARYPDRPKARICPSSLQTPVLHPSSFSVMITRSCRSRVCVVQIHADPRPA
jgi:hypothetical protein